MLYSRPFVPTLPWESKFGGVGKRQAKFAPLTRDSRILSRFWGGLSILPTSQPNNRIIYPP